MELSACKPVEIVGVRQVQCEFPGIGALESLTRIL
jgi:hypothetical protein